MGNKVNPIGMRLQVNRTWDSRWYADTKDYGDLLLEDVRIRDFIKEECKAAGVSRVIIEALGLLVSSTTVNSSGAVFDTRFSVNQATCGSRCGHGASPE